MFRIFAIGIISIEEYGLTGIWAATTGRHVRMNPTYELRRKVFIMKTSKEFFERLQTDTDFVNEVKIWMGEKSSMSFFILILHNGSELKFPLN